MPDLSDPQWQDAREDEEIARVIAQGGEMMPGFGERISDQGIDALVKHVRSLGAGRGDGSQASAQSAGSPRTSAPDGGRPDGGGPR